jgi:RNA polymerase sigma-70 factor (ECF subfamily)
LDASDEQLLRQYVAGETAAMNELFVRYKASVYSWLCSASGQEAEDIYQDVWLRVISKAHTFKGMSFRVWLWSIARNLLVDRLRKKHALVILDESVSEDKEMPKTLLETIASESPGILETMTQRERKEALSAAINSLSYKLKEVVLLRVYSELPFKEIARVLDLNLNTVLFRMHMAVVRLKEVLGERGVS